MKYDTTVHLPAQIDALIQCFQKADIPGMERSLDNIKNIIKDQKFKKTLNEHQIDKQKKIEDIQRKALDAAKTVLEAKSFTDLYVDLEEIKNDLLASLELLERDYWNTVKEYITLYVHETEEDKIDDVIGGQSQ